MYIVNTSFFVEQDALDRWLEIINGRYIPLLRKNGFVSVTLTKVLDNAPSSHFTYALMVEAEDMERYGLVVGELLDKYREMAGTSLGERVLYLTTLMKKIEG